MLRLRLVVALILFTAWHLSAAATAPLLLVYRSWSDQLAVPDRVAEVRVFADGRVEVHRPGWWRNAGAASLRLSPQRLAALRQALAAAEPALRDPVALATAVAADDQRQRQLNGTVHEDSERVITAIDYRDDAGRVHAFTFENLQHAAARKPTLPTLQAAQQLAAGLHQLLSDPALAAAAADTAVAP